MPDGNQTALVAESCSTCGYTPCGCGTDDGHVPVIDLSIAKTASVQDGAADEVGDVIHYRITVENTGNVALTDVTVSDVVEGTIVTPVSLVWGDDGDGVLEAGETWTFAATYTITQSDLNQGDDIDNVATVDTSQTDPESDDAHVAVTQNPDVTIDKLAFVQDGAADEVGDVIEYRIRVENSGNIDITGVTLTDVVEGSIATPVTLLSGDDGDLILETNEVWTYSASYTLTQSDLDQGDKIDNVATIDTSQTAPESDDAHVSVTQIRDVSIDKSASVQDGAADEVGDVINYTIVVTNTGNVGLSGVTVVDEVEGSISTPVTLVGGDDGDLILETDEAWTYSASYTLTQSDLNQGDPIDNVAYVLAPCPASDDAHVPVTQLPDLSIDKSASVQDGAADEVGDVVNYTIVVDNTGNIDLLDVTVTDMVEGTIVTAVSLVGGDDGDRILQTGETWTYSSTYTLTQDDLDQGDAIDNIATVDTSQTSPESDDAHVPVTQLPDLAIDKSATVLDGAADEVGDVISYRITIDNTGNVGLTGVTVTDVVEGSIATPVTLVGGDDGDTILETNEVWTYSASYTLTQSDLNQGDAIDNIATVDTSQTGPESDDAHIPVTQLPDLAIDKLASVQDGSADEVGDVIQYLIRVDNTGNVDLTGVTLTDVVEGSIATPVTLISGDDGDSILETNETWTYSSSYTLTQSDLNQGDPIDNIATVDTSQTTPESDDAHVPVVQFPDHLAIDKSATVLDGAADEVGDVINYRITVDNTGNIDLTGVTVTDVVEGSIATPVTLVGGDDGDTILETNEVWTYSSSYTLTQDDLNQGDAIDNVATVDTSQTSPESDDAHVPVTQLPDLAIDKSATVLDGAADEVGDVINYRITVDNTGNINLTGVTLSDVVEGMIATPVTLVGGDDGDTVLETNEVWTYSASYTLTQSDLNQGDAIDNIATVDTSQTDPESDDAHVPVTQFADLVIDKSATVLDGAADEVGDVISYTITVDNAGNIDLTDVALTDVIEASIASPVTLVGGDDGDQVLETNETWTYSASYTLTQSDLDQGDAIDNIATVDTSQTGPESDDAHVPVTQMADLAIDKSATVLDGAADEVGDVISYTITVDNTGNIGLTGVTLTDVVEGSIATPVTLVTGDDGDAILETNEVWTYSASYTLTQSDLDQGDEIDNIATVDTSQTGPESDDAHVPVIQPAPGVPDLSIDKIASVQDGTADEVGDVISYTIVVDNTGDVDLTGVTLTDMVEGSIATPVTLIWGDDGDNVLETSETWTYSSSYTLTQSDLNQGDAIDNIATVDTSQTDPESDDAHVPVTQMADLAIDKSATVLDGAADEVGDVISYRITVDNTGNIDLTGVTLVDVVEGSIAAPVTLFGGDDGDSVLETNEVWTYSASYTLTQSDLDQGDPIDNIATVDTSQTGPESDDAHVPVAQNPDLAIDKSATVLDGAADEVGDITSYRITVDNTGNVNLTGVTVTDMVEGSIATPVTLVGGDDGDTILETNEVWTYSASYTVTQADLNQGDAIDNIATVDTSQTGPETDDAHVPVTQLPDLAIDKSASVLDGAADEIGDVINYTITVDNTGNIDLTGVTLIDIVQGSISTPVTLTGGDDGDSVLETNETWTYSATYTLTQADLNCDEICNVATVDTSQTGPESDDAQVPIVPGGDVAIDKSATVLDGAADEVGDVISYRITVDNTGSIGLTGVTVTDMVEGSIATPVTLVGGDDGDTILETNEVWTYSSSYTLTQSDLDQGDAIDNVATVDTSQTSPESDDAHVPVTQCPDLAIEKSATVLDGAADEVGDVIRYTITVDNTGSISLTGVTLTDMVEGSIATPVTLVGGDDGDTILETNEVWTYSASYTLTQSDLDQGDPIDNIATVGTSQTYPESDDAHVPVIQPTPGVPDLAIDKSATVLDGAADEVGDVINYTITVDNTGNVNLTGVTLTDMVEGSIATPVSLVGGDDGDTILETNEVWTYSASYTLTQSDLDQGDAIDNIATVDTSQTDPESDDAHVPVTQMADLAIDKSATVLDGAADEVGDVISYMITVDNTGNIGLTGVTLTDMVEGSIATPVTLVGGDDGDTILETNEVWTYSASYTLTQADLDEGDTIDNIATVDTSQTAPESDDAHVPVIQPTPGAPDLAIYKSATVLDGAADEVGDVINYTVTVDNTGDVNLTGVTLTDMVEGSIATPVTLVGGDDGDTILETNEVWTYSASYTLTQADLDQGDAIDNIATVDTSQTSPETDDAHVPVTQCPDLAIEKSATVLDGAADEVGDVISYTITVDNTGNIGLTGVTLTDMVEGSIATPVTLVGGDDGDTILETNEVWTYSASYTLTQADLDQGDEIDNIVTVDTSQTHPESDDAHVPVVQPAPGVPDLAIDKSATVLDGAADEVGDVINYTITVDNTGDVDLTDVTLTDMVEGSIDTPVTLVSGDDGDTILETDEVWTYSASYTLTQSDLDQGDPIDNIATVDTGQTGPESDDAHVSVEDCGPGVRTPGFWKSPDGLSFWDGEPGADKSGPEFPDGELAYDVDRNGDGTIDGLGLLLGDYNKNGLQDEGEDVFYMSIEEARCLLDPSCKEAHDETYVLARDAIATWLNSLAGNSLGEESDPYCARAILDGAIDWMQYATSNTASGQVDVEFDTWSSKTASVRANHAFWQSGIDTNDTDPDLDIASGSDLHEWLDEYNNTGSITVDGVTHECACEAASFYSPQTNGFIG